MWRRDRVDHSITSPARQVRPNFTWQNLTMTARVRSWRWLELAEEARTIAAEIGDNDLGRAVLEAAISYEEFAMLGDLAAWEPDSERLPN